MSLERQELRLHGHPVAHYAAGSGPVVLLIHGITSFAGRRRGAPGFLHTARSILDGSGQRVSATDRLYLAEGMPTLIVWGDRDPMIPAAHGLAAHALIPHSRLELFDGAGHYPFEEDPERFADVLRGFIAGSPAAVYDEEALRTRLREGAPA